jgi:hypothetical protein
MSAAAFSFPDPVRPGLTAILVRVGTGALRFSIDPGQSTYTAQAAVVVRLRDQEGQEVQKLSQEYIFTGDAGDVEAAKRGEILFYRDADVPPGVYTMESVVYDAGAGQGSARVSTISIGEPALPAMSSLVIARRVEDVQESGAVSAHADAPLYVGRMLIYPNADEPILRSAAADLPFYFTLYGSAPDAKAYAQLLRNGQALAEAPMALPHPSAGRIQHVGRLPIGALPAGTYELRIRVVSGDGEVSRAAYFTLRD